MLYLTEIQKSRYSWPTRLISQQAAFLKVDEHQNRTRVSNKMSQTERVVNEICSRIALIAFF